MTCIAAIVEDGTVYMAGDSAAASGYMSKARKDSKVWRDGDFVFGFTSSFRMGQILRWQFEPPAQECYSVEEYMATDFIEGVRSCFKEFGYSKIESNKESAGKFLVGYRARIFSIGADFQVGEAADNYDAVGCGEDFALGSLFTSKGTPKARLEKALLAASTYSGWVRPPFTIVSGGAR